MIYHFTGYMQGRNYSSLLIIDICVEGLDSKQNVLIVVFQCYKNLMSESKF